MIGINLTCNNRKVNMLSVETNEINDLKELVDNIKEKYGDKVSVESLTLVVKVDGWDMKAFGYENGYVYEI